MRGRVVIISHIYSQTSPHTYTHTHTHTQGEPTAAAAKLLQTCLTLCDPIDSSPPGSPSLGFSRQEHWSGLPFPSPMHESEKWKRSHSVVSDSSRPHGLQPTRLLHPWDFPGKSIGVGCHHLLWDNLLLPYYFRLKLISSGWRSFLPLHSYPSGISVLPKRKRVNIINRNQGFNEIGWRNLQTGKRWKGGGKRYTTRHTLVKIITQRHRSIKS